MRVSPRRLFGWEPSTVTTYEYDGSGRVVRAVTVQESEFSDWDVAALLADRAEAAVPRGPHGIPIADATDPANQYKFSVELPTTDFAARALHEAQERYRKQYPDADMGSLLWRVERKA
ncbi:hypothetical protein D8M34_06600 [Microbacterium sp. HSID17254]|nr:hypothetical protein D8M34_06600 [Microbacterium sp. HSID17254]